MPPHICGWTATHTSHVDQKLGPGYMGMGAAETSLVS